MCPGKTDGSSCEEEMKQNGEVQLKGLVSGRGPARKIFCSANKESQRANMQKPAASNQDDGGNTVALKIRRMPMGLAKPTRLLRNHTRQTYKEN